MLVIFSTHPALRMAEVKAYKSKLLTTEDVPTQCCPKLWNKYKYTYYISFSPPSFDLNEKLSSRRDEEGQRERIHTQSLGLKLELVDTVTCCPVLGAAPYH